MKKRYILTESTKSTPCISNLIDEMEDMMDILPDCIIIVSSDITVGSTRSLDVTFDLPIDPQQLVAITCGQFATSLGSDITYKEITV